MSRPDPFSAPLPACLLKLREHFGGHAYRCTEHPDRWVAKCPACAPSFVQWPLTITRHRGDRGPITLRCSAGCSQAVVEAALNTPPAAAPASHPLTSNLLDLVDGLLDERVRLLATIDRLAAERTPTEAPA